MKLIFNLCGIALAGFLGYALEPNLRGFLTGQTPGTPSMASTGRVKIQMGEGAEKVDLESLRPEQLPEMVSINTDLKVNDSSTGITMNIPAGNTVKLVSIEGGNAVVSQGDSYVGRIPVMDTDLLQRLADMPQISTATSPAPETSTVPETPPTPEPAAQPESSPFGDPTQDPFGEPAEPTAEPAGDLFEEPAVEPAVEPAAEPATDPAADPFEEPAAEPATEPTGEPTTADSGDVVQVMQASVKSGQIKEFKFDQVTAWKAGENEKIDGETYETGIVLYRAVTVLGEKTLEAKAFIKDGKVRRWIWTLSGMEMK